jgi:hypothetical protein
MEDRHSLAQAGGLTIAAVFDGHGGDGASTFCAAEIVAEIEGAFRQAAAGEEGTTEGGGRGGEGGGGGTGGQDGGFDGESGGVGARERNGSDAKASHITSCMSSALHSCFVSLNARFLSCYPDDTSGCTALAVVLLPHVILAANAGDCRAYLWLEKAPLLPLSREHVASDETERARVLARGGEVQATSDGKLRVGGVIQVGTSGLANADVIDVLSLRAHMSARACVCELDNATLRRPSAGSTHVSSSASTHLTSSMLSQPSILVPARPR